MSKFLVRASYSSEAWGTQIENPQNRIEIVGKQMEAMGQMGNSEEATMPDDLPFGMSVEKSLIQSIFSPSR